ncbi:MAG: transporter substrate-binding domain-containing protein [Candidatus Delongbacteria bacterium]|nr:transporter substrate-binding domain-containing protein [Candidatus Delongbacteria bacterium]MBN2836933.1 transporter substrate-binding domain-containing protein [Candidatus Delongbacteria bacterium]
MKRIAFFLLSVLTVSLLLSCSKHEENVLKVATNAEYPPFEFKEGAEHKGIDIELAKLIGAKLGMKVEVLDIDFDAIIPSLVSKKADMAMSAMTITDKRKEKIDFSSPYYIANQSLISEKTKDLTIKSEEDLANYLIGVQTGTTGQSYIDENLINKNIMKKENLKKYPTNIEAITDMLNGNVDLVIIDDSAAKGYEKLKPIKTVYTIDSGESYGIAFPKGSQYREKVDQALKEILNSEDWIKILRKYL